MIFSKISKRGRVLLILMALSSFSISAQDKKGKIYGHVLLVSDEVSSSSSQSRIVFSQGKSFNVIPVSDAAVELITGKDTLRKVSDRNGYYTFKDVPFGEYLIRARHISYVSSFQKVNHFSSETKKDLQMKEETFLLDAIKLKGEIPLLTLRGDTVVINPLAVKTMEGDAAIEIIRQVPGIKIDEMSGIITAFGEPLTRTYVGGKLIFGEDAKVALDNLDAALVSKMKIYDEVTDMDMTEDGRFEARTRRVMNIETTKEILSSRTGHAIAGVGKDLSNGGDKGNDTRYKLGGTINFFSEKLFYNANVFTNNTNNPSNKIEDHKALISSTTGEQKISYAGIGYKKRWGDNKAGSSLQLDYSFNNRNSEKEQTLENIYFPGELYTQREYRSVSSSTQNRSDHKAAITYNIKGKINGKEKTGSIIHTMSFSDSEISDYSGITNIVNSNIAGLNKVRHNEQDNYSINDNVSLSIIKNLSLAFSSQFSKQDGDSWRADTSFSDQSLSSEKIFRSSPVGSNVKLSAKARYAYYPRVFAYEYQIDYQKGKSREIRYDLSSPGLEILDDIHSFDYSTNNTTHIARIMYTPNKKTNFFPVNVTIALRSSCVKKDELIPFNLNYSKTFNSIVSSISYGHKIGKSKDDFMSTGLSFRYSSSNVIPSLEQLRTQVNDSDPLFLVAGNSALKQTFIHNFNIQLRSFSPEVSFSIDASIMKNQIVPKERFFPVSTVLPEYDNYLVPANSTLTTYENLNGAATSSFRTYYSTRISSLKTNIDVDCELGYNRRPSFVQEKINITNSYSGRLKFLTQTTLPNLRITFSSTSQYIKSINTLRNTNEYFNESLNFSYNYNIGKYFFTRGRYNLALYEPLTKGSIGFTNNILSLSGGLRLFKGRMNIDLSVYDIFNKSTNFKTMMYTDYVQNTWTPTFGRYWSFNVIFQFRSTKGPSNVILNDGSVSSN